MQQDAAGARVAGRDLSRADTLYHNRTDLDSARQAVAIWDAQLRVAPDHEAAWKLSRAMYWLGTHDAPNARRAALERGIEAGRQAAALAPGRPEGWFWQAANMGALAESFGLSQGLKYRGLIRETLEKVLAIDPAYQHGSADRALGRWYARVPGLFGGSDKKSEEHLRKSLTYNPNSIASRFFLAETLFDLDRDSEARLELQKVVMLVPDPEWEPEDREFQQQARTRLARR